MIQVDKLSIAYNGEIVFSDVSFTLQKSERCGLVGRNGSGKSTLFRLIIGQEAPDSGRVALPKGYSLGYLDQHIRFTQPTVLEEAALGLRSEERDNLYEVERILFGLGLKAEDLDKAPDQLSGGYHLRLHLAKVLLSRPDCLLLDEPTNYLDIVSIRWLEKFLKAWKGEFILITHDREFMDAVTTHTMGIHANKVRKVEGGTIVLFEQILQQEEIHERTRLNLQKKQEHLQSFIDRFGAKASKAAQAQSRAKMLQRIPVMEKLKELYHLKFNFNEASFMGKKMLDAQALSFAYETDAPKLIEDFSLKVEKGNRIAIIGKNGRGKSTLLRLLAQDLTPWDGSVDISDNVKLGYFGQTNIQRLDPKHSVEDEISAANPQLNFTQVKGICGLMMFSGDLAKKPIAVLSGGEKSRVLLGKILAKPCNLLFLDEPTHHLDMESIEALIDAIEDFSGAVVIVTHSELILKRMNLDQVIVCHQNRQETFLGHYDDFLEQVGWEDEEETRKPKKKSGDLQDQKRKRAELINARSQALKSLEKEIKRLETVIIQLEQEQQKEQSALLEAVQSGSSQIAALTRTTGERQKKIDDLFREFERLNAEYQEKSDAFKKQLDV